MTLTLIGRSSSHFTRVTRLFAHELGLAYEFRPVFDFTTLDATVYGNNPALKIPVLLDEAGPLFGTENICRALIRHAGTRGASVVMRGDLADRTVANAEELTLHAMDAEVTLIMTQAGASGQQPPAKVTPSLKNSLAHLDQQLDAALRALPPERSLSFLEVTLYCLVRHLEFRSILDTQPFERLRAFAEAFEARAGARATAYQFDKPS